MKLTKSILVFIIAVFMIISAVGVSAEELLISSALATTETENTIMFSDLIEDAPYKDAVYKLVKNGVLNGYPDGTFLPDGNLTRAEMCKMINLTFGYTDFSGAAGFPDVNMNEWYAPYVLAAQKAGYVIGDELGNFNPNDNITREEVCAIICRIVKPYDLGITIPVADTVSEWAKDYVNLILQNNLMSLDADGSFRSTVAIKRHELASTVAPFSTKPAKINCTITFAVQDASFTKDIEIGTRIAEWPVPETTPEGYVFAGWSITDYDQTPIDKTAYIFIKDVTLYPIYEKKTYAVKFYAGTILADEQLVKHGEFASTPNQPKKDGYAFSGWALYGQSVVVSVEGYAITADTTFEAQFKKAEVGGAAGGGAVGGGTTGGGTTGGGTTGGGTTGGGTTGGGTTGDDNTGDDNTGDDNTGDDNTGDDNTGDDNTGDDNTGDDNTGDDNTGDDNTGDDNTGDDNTGDDNTDDEEIIVEYDVTFIADGDEVSTKTVERGDCAKAPSAPKIDGYDFLYWSLSEDGEEVDVSSYEITKNTTFYAVYELKESNPNDSELIQALKKGVDQFGKLKLSSAQQRNIRKIIVNTMKDVIDEAADGAMVDKKYIKTVHAEEIAEVKAIVAEMDDDKISEFITVVSNNVDDDVEDILVEYFIDASIRDKYLK